MRSSELSSPDWPNEKIHERKNVVKDEVKDEVKSTIMS